MVAVVVGSTSRIGRSIADRLAELGHELYLAAADTKEQARVAADLRIRRRVPVTCGRFEAGATETHAPFVRTVADRYGQIDWLVIASDEGLSPAPNPHDPHHERRMLESNFLGPVSLLGRAADLMEKAGSGTILVLSSIAGDRGREGDYVYGGAKGGLNVFVEGLRQRLKGSNVRVVTAKLGLLDTGLLDEEHRLFRRARPDAVARAAVRAGTSGPEVVYAPWYWGPVMGLAKSLPEPLFKRFAA